MPDISLEPAEAIPMSSSRTATIPGLASIFQRRNTDILIPADSFGDEIKSERCKRLNARVWFPRGEIKKTFEESLKAKIVSHLDGEGLTFPQVYLNLYIIGQSQDKARPKVVFCCEDSAKLMIVRASIRQSKILKEPEFRMFDLGISSWPLETEGPVDKLATDDVGHPGEQTTQRLDHPSPPIEIFTTDTYPRLGARLFSKRLAEKGFIRSATAGPTLRVLDKYYILTVGHIRDVKLIDRPSDLDVLDVGGLSDSSGDGDESGGEETIMSEGSLSPEESQSRSNSPHDIIFSPPGSPGPPSVSAPQVYSGFDPLIPGSLAKRKDKNESLTHIMTRVGFIDLHCADGPMMKPGLDYALVNVSSQRMDPPDHRLLNRVELHNREAVLELKSVVEFPNDTVGVIAITSSTGIQRGNLVTSSSFFRDNGSPFFQKLGVVQLDGAITEGDCGSVVIDEMTGDIYGHIAMGCSGTNLAYIIPATELYRDIRSKLSKEVCFASIFDIQSLWNAPTTDAPQQTMPTVLKTGQLQFGAVQAEEQFTIPDYSDTAFSIPVEDLEPPPSPGGIGESYGVTAYDNIATGTSRLGIPELCFDYAEDDTSVMAQPSRHVDYLSNDWREEDILPSWKYVISRRGDYSNAARLENAAWRAWMKTKNNIQTVSPERLNWLKECDVTWLYGPLQTGSTDLLPRQSTDNADGAEFAMSNPFLADEMDKKPILKKRSKSEIMLWRSTLSSSPLKQETASLRAQERKIGGQVLRTLQDRATSDFLTFPSLPGDTIAGTTVPCPPSTNAAIVSPIAEKKHIHFNERVEQFIAVEGQSEDKEDDVGEGH